MSSGYKLFQFSKEIIRNFKEHHWKREFLEGSALRWKETPHTTKETEWGLYRRVTCDSLSPRFLFILRREAQDHPDLPQYLILSRHFLHMSSPQYDPGLWLPRWLCPPPSLKHTTISSTRNTLLLCSNHAYVFKSNQLSTTYNGFVQILNKLIFIFSLTT